MCNSLGIWKCPYFLMAEGDHVFQTRLWTKVLFFIKLLCSCHPTTYIITTRSFLEKNPICCNRKRNFVDWRGGGL